jgi:hypothetical protein
MEELQRFLQQKPATKRAYKKIASLKIPEVTPNPSTCF